MSSSSPQKPGLLGFRKDNPAHRILLFVVVLAIIARLVVIIGAFPHLHWADESYKFFEPAHRMAFGYGLVVWELRDGIVSLVLPALFAGLWTLVEPVLGGPQAYLYAANILLAAISIAGVVAITRMGLRTSRTHGLIAGVAAATWFEIVYYAGRPLSEAVATTALLVALSLASMGELTRSRLTGVGASLGLALMLRIQLAPALLVAAVLICGLQFRARWWPLVQGAAVPVLLFASVDWLLCGSPFASNLENVRVQLLEDKASVFGVSPPGWYFTTIAAMWGRLAWPALLLLIVLRTRASLLWIAVAGAIIATHSLVPHKEYRFIFPALALLVVTAAMSSADLVERLRARLGPRAGGALVVSAVAIWIAVSAARPFAPGIQAQYSQGADLLNATFELAEIKSLCGVLFEDFQASNGGGYAYIHRKVPIYGFGITPRPSSTEAYNAVVLKRESVPEFSSQFQLRTCFGSRGGEDVCVMQRDGACRHDPALRSTLQDPNI